MLHDVTVMVLTFNEAPNISRTLSKLRWAQSVLILDSFSTDGTIEIANSFPNVTVIQRPFDSFAQQCNFGLQQIQSKWVLSLDADYVLSDALEDEITHLSMPPEMVGYRARFRYCIRGRRLRGSLYPPRTVLYQKEHAQYQNDGHGHRVVLNGDTKMLSGWIDHDDRKTLDRWLREQNRYMIAEAKNLLETPKRNLKLVDRLRLWIVPAPFLVFLYTLLVKGLVLDGWPGFYYVMQRTVAESLLSLRLVEAMLGKRRSAE